MLLLVSGRLDNGSRATAQRDELVALQFIELHQSPSS